MAAVIDDHGPAFRDARHELLDTRHVHDAIVCAPDNKRFGRYSGQAVVQEIYASIYNIIQDFGPERIVTSPPQGKMTFKQPWNPGWTVEHQRDQFVEFLRSFVQENVFSSFFVKAKGVAEFS